MAQDDESSKAWEDKLKDMAIKRSDINVFIMDYLMSEGFKGAAEKFEKEASFDASKLSDKKVESCEQIDQRIAVRERIENGNIEESIQLINDYYPDLIDNNRDIYFKLQQQQLIELIRNNKVEEAIKFAQDQISGDKSNCIQIEELEKTMALLAFENPEKSPYSDLLQSAHRQHLASRINEAILKDQFGGVEAPTPRLVTMLKLLLYTQDQLDKRKVNYTKLIDLKNARLEKKN